MTVLKKIVSLTSYPTKAYELGIYVDVTVLVALLNDGTLWERHAGGGRGWTIIEGPVQTSTGSKCTRCKGGGRECDGPAYAAHPDMKCARCHGEGWEPREPLDD
jgi:hypothetical protein